VLRADTLQAHRTATQLQQVWAISQSFVGCGIVKPRRRRGRGLSSTSRNGRLSGGRHQRLVRSRSAMGARSGLQQRKGSARVMSASKSTTRSTSSSMNSTRHGERARRRGGLRRGGDGVCATASSTIRGRATETSAVLPLSSALITRQRREGLLLRATHQLHHVRDRRSLFVERELSTLLSWPSYLPA